jgi:uncharacterized protein
MTRKIDLGRLSDDRPFAGDLDLILSSNLLVQANSGGGKSWALRRMIEQSFGHVPQIIIDPEGEFSTLRQKFDLILVGKDGETPADVRSAQLLAHRLLELGVSAVVDLFEMSPTARPLWVATFLQALVDAPKRLWRELLVYVDEAHMLAPEPGHGAVDSEAHRRCRSAMIEMASRGRKRGYGLVAATQRLGKLSKDFAAELKSVLIGQTFIDIDRERAAGNLGIAKADKAGFFRDVKNLAPGHFFAMGRALVLEPTPVKIGDVQTEHPKAGRRQSAPPPPTEKIRHLLPQLADLPREAEQKILTEKELRARIVDLERQLAQAKPGPETEKRVDVPVVPPEWLAEVRESVARLALLKDQVLRELGKQVDYSSESLARLVHLGDKFRSLPASPSQRRAPCTLLPMSGRAANPNSIARRSAARAPAATVSEMRFGTGERATLTAAAQHGEDGVTREQLSVLTGYKRSSRDAYLQRLRAAGLIEEDCGAILATEAGLAALGPGFEPLPKGADLLEHWRQKLPEGECRVLDALVEAYPEGVDRESVGSSTGYARSSRDAYLQRLRARRLVEDVGSGNVRASKELFG